MLQFFRILSVFFLVLFASAAVQAAGGGNSDGDHGAGNSGGSLSNFVNVPPISIPIIQRGEVYGFLQLEVVLEIHNPGLQKRVRALFPRLRDAYLRNMNAYAGNHIRPGYVPDLGGIERTLQAITNHTLGTAEAHVLFGQIMIQKAY